MGTKISVDLSDQESLYLSALEIVSYAQEIVTLMTQVSDNLASLSSQGYFHDRMSPDSDEGDGMSRYILKAQEFQTLCEVTAQHIQNTYQALSDTDRALAVYVLNLLLNDSSTDAATKEDILQHPEDYVSKVEEGLKASKE